MSKKDHMGRRTKRSDFPKRIPDLGYYFIVTDTKRTEENYMNGLKKSLPEEMQNRIVIRVKKTQTDTLVQTCKNQAAMLPQYSERWILFDKDRVKNFDQIIDEAMKENINVAWSNPCIELWFSAYFGKFPNCLDSTSCCSDFGRTFEKKTGQEYDKKNSQIYKLLNHWGNEDKAIEYAENRWIQFQNNDVKKPSDMCPCTTVYQLVKEIKGKRDQGDN